MKLWTKTEEWAEGKFLVVRRDGSVPHWPHFVLGARDPIAARVIRFYADAVMEQGGDDEYAGSLYELADDFDAYRESHGEGDPFSPPHRVDDPFVLAAMRGEPSVIVVHPDTQNMKKTP
jgi:hypothetical protein